MELPETAATHVPPAAISTDRVLIDFTIPGNASGGGTPGGDPGPRIRCDRTGSGAHALRAQVSLACLGTSWYSWSLYWILRTEMPRISAAREVEPPVNSSVLRMA